MGDFLTRNYRAFFTIFLAAIVGLAFYVGMLEGERGGGEPVTLSCGKETLAALAIPLQSLASAEGVAVSSLSSKNGSESTEHSSGAFAGSKNGTKYYTPDCAGLKRIKPENLIWFQTAEDATLQGYTAAQC